MTKIYATLVSRDDGPPYQNGDLVLVELPANCSVNGTVCQFREALDRLAGFALEHASPQQARYIEHVLKTLEVEP